MPRLQFNDVSFEVPAEWRDRTVVTLVGQDSKRFAPSVVIAREDAVAGETLADCARRQAAQIAQATKKHTLVAEREEKVTGGQAYVLEHRFLTPERAMVRQLQYFLRRDDEVLVMTLTCADQELKRRAATLRKIAESWSTGSTPDRFPDPV